MHNAPERIYLQIDPDGIDPTDEFLFDGVTWCQDKVNETDVEYVRADEIDRLRAEVAELRGVATLAYRALDDAYRVLSTIDGDDTHEQFELGLLAKRVQDVSVSLFALLRQNDAALAKDSSHE